jgi:hypothetical protein
MHEHLAEVHPDRRKTSGPKRALAEDPVSFSNHFRVAPSLTSRQYRWDRIFSHFPGSPEFTALLVEPDELAEQR